MEDGDEQVLARDGVTDVVRVGQTVRRPVRPFSSTVQTYLSHLRACGIEFVPEPLGYDEQGREVLSFVEGEVPGETLPDWATSDAVLVSLAQLVRRLHDAAAGWQPPPDAVWGSIPGLPPVPATSMFGEPELVSHQDYCPGNVVFRQGLPVALIDFDLARPTTRVADCVNALYWWAPLLHPKDRARSLHDADIAHRARLFADAYGLDQRQRGEVVPAAVHRARVSHVRMRAAAEADPVFRRWWDEGVKDRMPRAEQWLADESERITEALLRDRTDC